MVNKSLINWNHEKHDIFAFLYEICPEKGYTFHPELNPPYVFIGMCNPFYIGLRLSCEISSLE